MKLYEEFKLYENMWESTDSSNAYEDLRVKLIDEFSAKGFTQEVAILENCTLSASPYADLVIALKDTKDVLWVHPELTKPENFDKACVAVRVELAYPILDIKITDSKNTAEVKKALDTIKARLTPEEVEVANNFNLAGKHYTGLEVGTPLEESRLQKTEDVLSENKDTIYSFDLDAYNSSKDKMYTDKNNLSSYDVEGGYPYQFKGTYNEVVQKLNSIVTKGYDILMLFIENDATGEEVLGVDDRFLLYNNLVPANTPFLANVF